MVQGETVYGMPHNFACATSRFWIAKDSFPSHLGTGIDRVELFSFQTRSKSRHTEFSCEIRVSVQFNFGLETSPPWLKEVA